MKKIFALFISLIFFMNSAVFAAEPLHGYIEESDEYKQLQEELFTGEIEHLDRKDVINMTVSQVLDSSYSMEGDEFFAQVTSDVYGDD